MSLELDPRLKVVVITNYAYLHYPSCVQIERGLILRLYYFIHKLRKSAENFSIKNEI